MKEKGEQHCVSSSVLGTSDRTFTLNPLSHPRSTISPTLITSDYWASE